MRVAIVCLVVAASGWASGISGKFISTDSCMDITSPLTGSIITNPYVAGRPLSGASASLYVGRDDVFVWFEENLGGPRPSNALLLYGERRIGKTSTLYQLVQGDRGSRLRENQSRSMIPVYVDFQRLAGRPTGEWLQRLAQDIAHKVGMAGVNVPPPEKGAPDETSFAVFDRCLDQLENTLPPGGFILVAVDEFEQLRDGIDSGILDPNVLPYLRSQMQHRERIAFLICGSKSMLEPFWRSLIDLTVRYELQRLTHDETVTLIRRPIAGALAVEERAVEAIWEHTEGHPFVIQTICHRLVSLANRRQSFEPVTLADIEYVIRQLDGEAHSAQGVVVFQNKPLITSEGTQI